MITLRERYSSLLEENGTIQMFFNLENKDAHLKIIADSESRFELTFGSHALVIRPWGWTIYHGTRIGTHGDFAE